MLPFLLSLLPNLSSFASSPLPLPCFLPLPLPRDRSPPSPLFLGLRDTLTSPPFLFPLPPPLAASPAANQRAASHGSAPRRFRAGPTEPRPRVRRAAPRGGGRWGLEDGRRGRGARRDAGVQGCEGRGGRFGAPGMGQPRPGEAEPEARAARGPGLRGGRPGG